MNVVRRDRQHEWTSMPGGGWNCGAICHDGLPCGQIWSAAVHAQPETNYAARSVEPSAEVTGLREQLMAALRSEREQILQVRRYRTAWTSARRRARRPADTPSGGHPTEYRAADIGGTCVNCHQHATAHLSDWCPPPREAT